MEMFFAWLVFSAFVAAFASLRRNRSSFGWFILAVMISPLFAGILIAILKPLPNERQLPQPAPMPQRKTDPRWEKLRSTPMPRPAPIAPKPAQFMKTDTASCF